MTTAATLVDFQADPAGTSPTTLELGAVLQGIANIDIATLDGEPTIFAAKPWTDTSPTIIAGDDPTNTGPGAPLEYVLELALARDALTEWSQARGGILPSPAEAVAVVIDYITFDDCLPFDAAPWTAQSLRSLLASKTTTPPPSEQLSELRENL